MDIFVCLSNDLMRLASPCYRLNFNDLLEVILRFSLSTIREDASLESFKDIQLWIAMLVVGSLLGLLLGLKNLIPHWKEFPLHIQMR